MKVTYSQLKEMALGAEQAVESELGITFYRFNEEEMETYTNPQRLGNKCFSSAGIRLAFETDASALTLGVHVEKASSRTYFGLDVIVDGVYAGSICNYREGMTFAEMRDTCELGDFEQTFPLSAGKKQVEVYLPWSATATITKLELAEATFAQPVERDRILLMYGDSITQGYDAYRPSQSYSNRVADTLGMQVINKAIGGELFFPALAACLPTVAPEAITVAYGTNDWATGEREPFLQNSRAFLENLCQNHPETPIFLISPIWRADRDRERPIGAFEEVERLLRELADTLPQVTLISGRNFVPEDPALFADLRLHPNDDGFAHQGKNLAAALERYL